VSITIIVPRKHLGGIFFKINIYSAFLLQEKKFGFFIFITKLKIKRSIRGNKKSIYQL